MSKSVADGTLPAPAPIPAPLPVPPKEKPVATIAQKVLATQIITTLGNILRNMPANAAAYKKFADPNAAAVNLVGDAVQHKRLLQQITDLRLRNDQAYQDALLDAGLDPGEVSNIQALIAAIADHVIAANPQGDTAVKDVADYVVATTPVVEVLK